jgi:hypothetical protein
MRDNEVVDLSRNAWGRVIDRGTIDWIVSNRSIETNNARPDEQLVYGNYHKTIGIFTIFHLAFAIWL